MSHIENFIEYFKLASEKVCFDRHPTLHFVVPLYQQLLKACTENDDDNKFVKLLKAKAGAATKVRLDIRQDVGVFLNPSMKGLSFLIPIRMNAVLKKIKQLINEVTTQQPQTRLLETSNDTANFSDDDQN